MAKCPQTPRSTYAHPLAWLYTKSSANAASSETPASHLYAAGEGGIQCSMSIGEPIAVGHYTGSSACEP